MEFNEQNELPCKIETDLDREQADSPGGERGGGHGRIKQKRRKKERELMYSYMANSMAIMGWGHRGDKY